MHEQHLSHAIPTNREKTIRHNLTTVIRQLNGPERNPESLSLASQSVSLSGRIASRLSWASRDIAGFAEVRAWGMIGFLQLRFSAFGC
jgi:hypothetical protein